MEKEDPPRLANEGITARIGDPSASPAGSSSIRPGLFGQKASKSADGARARSLARVAAMTPRERMILALSLAEDTDELLARIGRAQG